VAVRFGITFGVSLNPLPRLADTLDVVLVHGARRRNPSGRLPGAGFAKGGGETTDKTRPADLVSGLLPNTQQGQDLQQVTQQEPAPEVELREIVAVESETAAPLQQTAIEQPESERPDATRLMSQSMDMASLRPELNRRREWQSKLPRREFISANTRRYEFASYMSRLGVQSRAGGQP
jgi:protein TonB